MTTIDDFRDEIRAWLEMNCPASVRQPGMIPQGGSKVPIRDEETRLWLERCAARGLTVPLWPVEYGGAGLDQTEYQVLLEELRRIHARSPLGGMGVGLIGPTLVEHGTEEQKLRHLPPIARGDTRWCQGYSEPNAGSDLASLQTRAVADGDQFVINGQKMWTSGADYADWIFCLTRTDPDVPKHDGISMILLKMDQPGVTTRPIRLISGSSPFCETFFDDAIARKDDLVGQLNRGWGLAKRLLQHERSGITILMGGATTPEADVNPLQVLLRQYRPDDPALRARIIRFEMDRRAYRLTQRRTVAETDDGKTPGPQTSIFELCAANLEKEEAELKVEILGLKGLGWEGDGFEESEISIMREWLSSKRRSIARGSNEVQKNIIAKRVLGLPD